MCNCCDLKLSIQDFDCACTSLTTNQFALPERTEIKLSSNNSIQYTADMTKVAVLGAAGQIGQPLSLLLKSVSLLDSQFHLFQQFLTPLMSFKRVQELSSC